MKDEQSFYNNLTGYGVLRTPVLKSDVRKKIRSLLEHGDEISALNIVKEEYQKRTDLQKCIDKLFPESKYPQSPMFTKVTKNIVVKLLKNNKREEVEALLIKDFADNNNGVPFDFKPPAKGFVLDISRPFEEWPIVKLSREVQNYIYNSNRVLVGSWIESKKNTKDEEWYNNWFTSTGVNDYGYLTRRQARVQLLNLLFKEAFNKYKGVELKVENRNKKKAAKAEKLGKTFEPESAYDENDLLHQKPGISPHLYCVQNLNIASVQATIESLQKQIVKLTNKLKDDEVDKQTIESDILCKKNIINDVQKYIFDYSPEEPLPTHTNKDRLSIPEGQPGWIPPHHRDLVNPNKRVHMPKGSGKPIVVMFCLENDWAAIDVRGLLRNARYRKIVEHKVSLNQLMDLFTGDPVIDTRKDSGYYSKGIVTFSYKQGSVPVTSTKVLHGKSTRNKLLQLAIKDNVALVGIDLGQINPLAAGIYDIKLIDQELIYVCKGTRTLSVELLDKIKEYRDSYTQMEIDFVNQAKRNLSVEAQKQIDDFELVSSENIKRLVCDALSIDSSSLPWDKMSSNTFHISNCLVDMGVDKTVTHFEYINKKSKKPSLKLKSDKKWCHEYKPKLDVEIRKAWNDEIWNLKRSSPLFEKKAKFKLELARRCVNYIIKETLNLTQYKTLCFAIEDLNLDNKVLSGAGKRDEGWSNFFVHKKENRWFMQALHKAISEQAVHHGHYVFEINKSFTSQTCPVCENCDSQNRSENNRTQFICTKCKYNGDADKDVATHNITKVAVTGQKLPSPKNERSGGKKKSVTARKAKTKGISGSINEFENQLIASPTGDTVPLAKHVVST